jgi:hypothetical protein
MIVLLSEVYALGSSILHEILSLQQSCIVVIKSYLAHTTGEREMYLRAGNTMLEIYKIATFIVQISNV